MTKSYQNHHTIRVNHATTHPQPPPALPAIGASRWVTAGRLSIPVVGLVSGCGIGSCCCCGLVAIAGAGFGIDTASSGTAVFGNTAGGALTVSFVTGCGCDCDFDGVCDCGSDWGCGGAGGINTSAFCDEDGAAAAEVTAATAGTVVVATGVAGLGDKSEAPSTVVWPPLPLLCCDRDELAAGSSDHAGPLVTQG